MFWARAIKICKPARTRRLSNATTISCRACIVYLKAFATPDERVSTYRTLVSHPRVPLWKSRSIRGIAYYSYLYTRLTPGGPTDEVEKWLEHEFETPAEASLHKAISDERLTPVDWKHLIRFVAAQDVRTPARLLENMRRWETDLPGILDDVMQGSLRKLELAKAKGLALKQPIPNQSEYIPFRVTTQIE